MQATTEKSLEVGLALYGKLVANKHTYTPNKHVHANKETHTHIHRFDEHSLIDLPAMLDHTLKVSQQDQLYYVGHSQGIITGFAGFTTNDTLASKLNKFFALAPVSTVKHISGLLYYISEFCKEIEVVEGGRREERGGKGVGREGEGREGTEEERKKRSREGERGIRRMVERSDSYRRKRSLSLIPPPPPPPHTHRHSSFWTYLDMESSSQTLN